MKNFMQNGSRMRWKNNGSAAVASGELVPLSGMVGGPPLISARSGRRACRLRGFFLLAKGAAASG